jgi:hypothetical protein
MAQYWIYYIDGAGSSNTLNLDNELNELTLGGNKRRFQFLDYAGQSGSALRGIGAYSKKQFIVTRTETIESGDASAWNSKRNDFMKYFTVPSYLDTYLYCQDGEQSKTLRTKVFCEQIPDDKYKNFRISDKRAFKLTSPSGVWENTSSTTGSVAITGSTEQSTSLTNNGILECPMTISFTPTGAETSWRIKIFEGYGIRFGGTFTAGVKYSYNMKTGKLTRGGAEVNAAQFIAAGSPFQLPIGTTTAYIKTSGAGTFEYAYNERYI